MAVCVLSVVIIQSLNGADEVPLLPMIATDQPYVDGVSDVAFTGKDNEFISVGDSGDALVLYPGIGKVPAAHYRLSQVRRVSRLGASGRIGIVGRQLGILNLTDADLAILTPGAEWLTSGFVGGASDTEGTMMAVGVLAGHRTGDILVFDVMTGRIRCELAGHHEGVMSVSFSRDGQLLASSDFGGSVLLWDIATRQVAARLRQGKGGAGTGFSNVIGTSQSAPCVRMSPTGNLLAVLVSEGATRLEFWQQTAMEDLSKWEQNSVVKAPYAEDFSDDMEFSSDGTLMAVGGEYRRGFVIDAKTRSIVGYLEHPEPEEKGQSRSIRCVEFSPDGRTLLSGSASGSIVLWDVSAVRMTENN